MWCADMVESTTKNQTDVCVGIGNLPEAEST